MELNENSISTTHWLPDTEKIKNRIIVKFVHRDTREIVYKKRASLMRKSMEDLPSVAKKIGKSIHRANRIYINKSLTSYRNRFFGRIHELKKSNKFKFLWEDQPQREQDIYGLQIYNSWRIWRISGYTRLKNTVVATLTLFIYYVFIAISLAWL